MTLALLLAAALACTAPAVVDGDTLRCAGERVRLFGIDAPELHGPSHRAVYPDEPPAWVAPAARARLLALATGRVAFRPAPQGRDRFGRDVDVCGSGAVPDLGRQLVREGLARDWPRWSAGAYAPDEAAARAARRGMWR